MRIQDFYGVNKNVLEGIDNFVRIKDYLNTPDTKEIYDSLNGNVINYKIVSSSMYILTNKKDGGKLYTCTQKDINYSGLYKESESGYTDLGNYNIPIKILNNVKNMNMSLGDECFALTYDDKLYCWGRNDGKSLGMETTSVPILYQGSELTPKNITNLFPQTYQSYITQKNEEGIQSFFVTGTDHVTGATGLGNTFNTWTNFELSLLGNENVKSVVSSNRISDYLVLTEKGNLYTWGRANKLGIGREDSTIIRNVMKVDKISDVEQITAGNGFFVAVKKDGSVWGTGSNIYGILGRWIGVDRNTPNSRYKTAFEWVECPELEI